MSSRHRARHGGSPAGRPAGAARPDGAGRPAGATRVAAAAALAIVTAVILVLTLAPAESPGGVESFSITLRAQGFRGLADSLANIILFAPFGAAVAVLRPGWVRPILAGAVLSIAIELAQLFVPGRYTSPWDVLFNTAGAAVGVIIVRHATWWLRPSPVAAAALAASALIAGLAVLLAGPLLFAPHVPGGTLVGQWTHVYEGAPRYEGRILEARVGDIPVFAWPVEQSRQLRAALFRDTVFLRVEAGPPPDGAAPLFAVAAPSEQGLLNLAVRHDDVILSYRMHARRVGLDQPDVRAHGILAGIAPGDIFTLRSWRDGSGNCIEVRADGPGRAADASIARTFCHAGFTAADTWALILYPVRRPLDVILPVLWAAALLFPAGFWSRNPIGLAACAIGILAAPALGNAIAGVVAPGAGAAGWPVMPPVPAVVVIAALAGLAAGYVVARHSSSRVLRLRITSR